MLAAPPRQSETTCWALAVGWAVAIFCTVPLARDIQAWVGARMGRVAFTYIVLGAGTVAVTLAVVAMRRAKTTSTRRYVWLLASAGAFVSYTMVLRTSPEEAFHFVEYGVLAILIFRALAHRTHDATIYITTLALGATVGLIDEAIQWVMPNRVWDLRDIGLNFFGVLLVVVPIAFGLRPTYIGRSFRREGILRMIGAVGLATGLLGVCLTNTPARIVGYATADSDLDLMIEYGHRHADPDIGSFYSRFDRDELQQLDRVRAEDAAKILDDYHDGERYGAFLADFTSARDPFVHEARVHLFRRDHYRRVGLATAVSDPKRRERIEIAYRENQIVARYFPNTLARSTFLLTEDQVAALEAEATKQPYVSPVSQGIFTRISEPTILVMLTVVFGLLFALGLGARRVHPPLSDDAPGDGR